MIHVDFYYSACLSENEILSWDYNPIINGTQKLLDHRCFEVRVVILFVLSNIYYLYI